MNKIRVYATCFWQNDYLLYNMLKDYGFGKAEWKNLEFVMDDSYDIMIIFTSPHNKSKPIDERKAVTFLTEPPDSPNHQQNSIHVCPMYIPLPWWVLSAHKKKLTTEMTSNDKTELLSAVTSELYWLKGHQKRLNFLLNLDRTIIDGLDIFGKKSTGKIFPLFQNYKNELQDKYDGLLPYQYHFACENSFIPDYFTEKILDPIIADNLCFYDGCNNIEEYIDPRAFIKIDVNSIHESIESIIRSIDNDEYSKRREFIVKEKKRILWELNPLNIIWAELNGKDTKQYFKLANI